MASSSAHHHVSSSSGQRWIHDVFLSFRGDDTRRNFVDHLYHALVDNGILVCRDDSTLERGMEISPQLVKAIWESRFSIIVFSENYAFSGWCLNELLEIVDCTEKTGQIAFPIFYDVDPSHVRKQEQSFAKAFVEHEKTLKDDKEKVQRWGQALSKAGNLSGWDSRGRHEGELVKEVAKVILYKLNHDLLHVDKDLVAISAREGKLIAKMNLGSDEGKFVHIYGLGGIGKTTIAKVVYNKISCQFEGCSYLANVRENSKNLVSLQKQLLVDILKARNLDISNVDHGRSIIKNRLCHKKVLVILDDVSDIYHLKSLAGELNWFGKGSRVIVTTRNKQLLVAHACKDDVIDYEVTGLNLDDSLELLSWKAFKHSQPPIDYLKLSKEVVNYAQGLPLALEVLGSHFCGKSKELWRSAIESLSKSPKSEINEKLKVSYDGLEQMERQIFLDVACFFKGHDKDEVIKMLNSSGFCADIGIEVLVDRSLINISNNRLVMHDLVQEMGRYIVRQPKNPCKWSRLWLYEDIEHALKITEGSKAEVEAIILDLPRPEEDVWPRPKEVFLSLSAKAFKKRYNLRLLKIHNVNLSEGLENLPDKLKILNWYAYPLKELPSSFSAERLVQLEMHRSFLERFWSEMKILENLKSIDLSWSERLIETPDFTMIPKLEQLVLDNCSNLLRIHPSIGFHKRLKFLSLKNCESLTIFPHEIAMESLESLNMKGCLKFSEFPEIQQTAECWTYLNLGMTAISRLPSSIGNLSGLKFLKLNSCKELLSLPSSVCRLKNLIEIDVENCSSLGELPNNMGDLGSLKRLVLDQTALSKVPIPISLLKNLEELSMSGCNKGLLLPLSSGLCSLTYLNLSSCNLSDEAIPHDLSYLSLLKELNLSENKFSCLPSSIKQLSQLVSLNLDDCKWIKELPELPSTIEMISANDCTCLRALCEPSISQSENLIFRFANCSTSFLLFADVALQFHRQVYFGNSRTFNMLSPGNDIPQWFTHQNSDGSSVCIRMPADWCNDKFRGFAFCIVAGRSLGGSPHLLRFELSYSLHAQGFPSFCIASDQFNWPKGANFENFSVMYDKRLLHDHMVFAYISRACIEDNSNRLSGYRSMEASFCFLPSAAVKVKKCGICLVYDDDDHDINTLVPPWRNFVQSSSVNLIHSLKQRRRWS